jgi:hypothetical protein
MRRLDELSTGGIVTPVKLFLGVTGVDFLPSDPYEGLRFLIISNLIPDPKFPFG